MNKCDFCTQSSPDGKCSCFFVKEDYCAKAIKRMMKVLCKRVCRSNYRRLAQTAGGGLR